MGISVPHAALDGVATADLGVANSAHQAIRRVSQGLGVAMVVALLGDRRTESLAAFRRVWIGIAVGYLLSVLAGLACPARRGRAIPPRPVLPSTPRVSVDGGRSRG